MSEVVLTRLTVAKLVAGLTETRNKACCLGIKHFPHQNPLIFLIAFPKFVSFISVV